MLFSKRMLDVTAADFEELRAAAYPETEEVEYKAAIPNRKGEVDPWYSGAGSILDYGRDKLLAEVVALANYRGGHVLLGVGDTRTKPPRADALHPLPRAAELAERLQRAAGDCIEPRLHGLQVRAVVAGDDGSGFIMFRVPRSFDAPHRLRGTMECYTRRGDETVAMTMREIQDMVHNVARGLAWVDERMARERAAFESAYLLKDHTGVQKARACIRATVVPSAPLAVPRDALYTAAGSTSRDFRLTYASGQITAAQIPVYGYNLRPIVRGLRLETAGGQGTFAHAMYMDGVHSLEFTNVEEITSDQAHSLFAEWILGAGLSAMHAALASAAASDTPAGDFSLEVQLLSSVGHVVLRYGQGSQAFRLGRQSLTLPRISFYTSDDLVAATQTLAEDVRNAGGVQFKEQITRIE